MYRLQSDGTLAALGSAASGSNPGSLTVDAGGRFALTADTGSDTVTRFRIEADGTLTSLGATAAPGTPIFVVTTP